MNKKWAFKWWASSKNSACSPGLGLLKILYTYRSNYWLEKRHEQRLIDEFLIVFIVQSSPYHPLPPPSVRWLLSSWRRQISDTLPELPPVLFTSSWFHLSRFYFTLVQERHRHDLTTFKKFSMILLKIKTSSATGFYQDFIFMLVEMLIRRELHVR